MEYVVAAVTLAALPWVGIAIGACAVLTMAYHHRPKRH